ncbi:MAG TPA: CRTAC1 family protein [Pirellulales bacterium]|nr:CRTAC1 family protein [Pirellulales bacterium]
MGRLGRRPSKGVNILSVAFIAFAGMTAVWLVLAREPQRISGFRDVASQNGIDFRMSFLPQEQGGEFRVNLYDHGCGVVVGDYDGDGADDVLFLNQLGANGLYRNRGDGTFDNVTDEAWPLALDDRICVGAAFGDYDNDGDQDLYVTSTRGGNVLFENDGAGRFRDVTGPAGVSLVAHSQTPAFFDYDNDGYLDLFVTNTARWTMDEFDAQARYFRGPSDLWQHVYNVQDRESNMLFRNNRDGTFSDATAAAGLSGKGWSGDVAAFDFDEDGDLDVLVTNMFGVSQLYRNDGRGHFDDVTRETLRRTSMGAIGAKAFDYNNDGRLDLFITDMHSDMWILQDEPDLVEPQKKYRYLNGPRVDLHPEKVEQEAMSMERLHLNYDLVLFGNSLFCNEGAGRFREVSDAAGVETFWPWGIAAGDFDNDGDQDVYLPSGMGYPYFYYPCSLLLNNGNGTFVDRAAEEGVEPPREGQFLSELIFARQAARSSRCAATADFDGDGRVDLMVNNFNGVPYYFKNQFPRRHYAAIRLRGTRSNRDAIGALAKLHYRGGVMVRQVECTGGYLSQPSKTLHFGLGDVTSIDRVEIHWPSGMRQVLISPAVDRLHEVIEPEGAAEE